MQAGSENGLAYFHGLPVADPGKNLTGPLHSNFGRGGRG